MSYCVVPQCYQPQNSPHQRVCQSCGAKLLLKDRYRAMRQLGQGGFGRTFLAIDEDIPSQPLCVIKQLYLSQLSAHAAEKAIALFHQEAVRLDELGHHSQIPTLMAHFTQDQQLYLVQEWIEGQTLSEEIWQRKAYSEAQIWALLNDLLPTLKFIHDRGIIHRDIKPANLIRRRSDQTLVLIDFGIAKVLSGTTSLLTGTVIGSPEYMAPEQNRGKALPASDLYSLGVVCVQLLTNRSPFDVFDIGEDRWIWRQFLPAGRLISDRLGKILDRLLYPALNDRYASVDQILQDLAAKPELPPAPVAKFADPVSMPVTDQQWRALAKLLTTNQWQAADTLTWNLIRQLLGKSLQSYVFSGELNRLPCDDLRRIDQLWRQLSRNRFGFSVQVRVYQKLGEDYGQFCDRVGWQHNNLDDHPKQWRFKASAPVGHLPSRLGIGGQQWWRHMAILADKLQSCGCVN
ncbi:protein kinase domain-containing protein [Pantanalinema sp. GBBB05]|uniref:protein kinase domain-containing protein n=1 Tax=Pantanalinema sp. GBBB05 TaxID=2604139 RepID=UPI001DB32568|nr:protein kinase [Pantanalinema sp. GBBB05]